MARRKGDDWNPKNSRDDDERKKRRQKGREAPQPTLVGGKIVEVHHVTTPGGGGAPSIGGLIINTAIPAEITSPTTNAPISIFGTFTGDLPPTGISARYIGAGTGQWTPLEVNLINKSFSGKVPVPYGQGWKIEVRRDDAATVVASVGPFSVVQGAVVPGDVLDPTATIRLDPATPPEAGGFPRTYVAQINATGGVKRVKVAVFDAQNRSTETWQEIALTDAGAGTSLVCSTSGCLRPVIRLCCARRLTTTSNTPPNLLLVK